VTEVAAGSSEQQGSSDQRLDERNLASAVTSENIREPGLIYRSQSNSIISHLSTLEVSQAIYAI